MINKICSIFSNKKYAYSIHSPIHNKIKKEMKSKEQTFVYYYGMLSERPLQSTHIFSVVKENY